MDVELMLQRETERLQAPYLCGPGNTCVDMIKFAESDPHAYCNWVKCSRLLRLTRRPKPVAK